MKAKYEEKPKRVKKEPKKEGGDIRNYFNGAEADDSNGVNDSNDGFFVRAIKSLSKAYSVTLRTTTMARTST